MMHIMVHKIERQEINGRPPLRQQIRVGAVFFASVAACSMGFFARWPFLPRFATDPLTQVLEHRIHRQAYTLVHQFRTMMMHQQEAALPAWLHAAETSGILELVGTPRPSVDLN